MPAAVVFAITGNRCPIRSLLQLAQTGKGALHIFLASHNSNPILHQVLKIVLNLIWVLAAASEGFKCAPRRSLKLVRIHTCLAVLLSKPGCIFTRSLAEHEQVR